MTSRAVELAHRLSTIQSDNPDEIRREVVAALQAYISCDFALYFKCVDTGEETNGLRFSGVVADGDRDLYDELLVYADQPVVETPWLPPHLDMEEVNQFIRTRSHYSEDYLRQFPITKKVFIPLEVSDQLRIILFDGPRFLGWLGLMRRGREEVFRRREQQLLNQVRNEINSAIARADDLESKLIENGVFAVLTPSGDIEHASRAFSQWKTRSRCDYLTSRVRAADADQRRMGTEIYEGVKVRLIRLDSTQMMRYLISIDGATAFKVGPKYWLTDRQCEIAEYAVAGATSPEIADELGLSVQTIKTHMRNIFRRLDVNSRAELATLFAQI